MDGKGWGSKMRYPKEALEPENLASTIDSLGSKLNSLESYMFNRITDQSIEIGELKVKLDKLEAQLKAATELHMRLIEENTAQIGLITRLINKPRRLFEWVSNRT